MAYNTGNPVGSTDPRDLYDNASNLDKLMSGPDPFYADRFNRQRRSWAGIEYDFNVGQAGRNTEFDLSQVDREARFGAFLQSSGYQLIGDYASGVTFAERNQYVVREGINYRPGNVDLPFALSGDWEHDSASLVLLPDDNTLRQQLADPSQGAAMIARVVLTAYSLAELAAAPTMLRQEFQLALGGRSGLFYFQSADLSAQVTADPLQGFYIAPVYDLTGASGAWVRQDGQALLLGDGYRPGWFGAVGNGANDDGPAIQAAYDLACSTGVGRVDLGAADYGMSTTISLDKGSCAFVGLQDGFRQTGSVRSPCYLRWRGGATPMFRQTTTGMTFRGFGVENNGSATDWLELNAGAQSNTYERLSFMATATHTAFTRSVIRSNGNRAGYSRYEAIVATSPAPVFLDIDGQATPNGITPFSFGKRCIFGASGADFTVIKITDETVENISIMDSTFNQFATAQLTIVDTMLNPLSTSIGCLDFSGNEIDSVGAPAARRQFRLTNVDNFKFDMNYITGGGSITAIGELYNSHMVSCDGNKYASMAGDLFTLDAASTAVSGINTRNPANSRGTFSGGSSGAVVLPYSAAMIVEASKLGQTQHAVFRVDVTNSAGYQFRLGMATPYVTIPGQVFTVEIRNVSGASISIPVFNPSSNFRAGSGLVAPAAGSSRSVTFYFDGTNAREISRSAADVPIA